MIVVGIDIGLHGAFAHSPRSRAPPHRHTPHAPDRRAGWLW